MSDSDSLDYLEPGFDPKSLTIPRLRSILVGHNIPYSSSAKKAQLVDLFNQQVVPQSKKILAARARAKRSSKGIVDADSTSSSNPFDDREELPPPPPVTSARRSRSPRKASARIKSEEPDYNQLQPMPPPVPSPSRRKPRASSRPIHDTDTDTTSEMGGSTTLRRKRRTEDTPKVKSERSEESLFRRTSDVFTSDNPFQSGSSPSAMEPTPTQRRRTGGVEKSRSTSSGTRRRTDVPAVPIDDHFAVSKSFEAPRAQRIRPKMPEPSAFEAPAFEPGEEFTPEEQLELAAEEANDDTAIATSRRTHQSSKSGWGTPLSILFITILGVYAGWYRQEKIAVGYCGVGQRDSSIPSEIDVPEWAHPVLPPQISVPQSVIDTLEPECEPCPPHAYCYADFSVRCEQDYILKSHPFSLGGLVPLPPTCEPDGEKVRRVQAVADRAVEELREQNAKYECGKPINEEGAKLESPAVEEQELKKVIDKKRSKKMNNKEFDDLWASALGEVKAREEVEVEVKDPPRRHRVPDSGGVSNTYLASTSLARVPLACAVRRSIRLGLARYRFQISALIAAICTAAYARARFLSDRRAAAQVPALVDLVLERLATQKQLVGYGDDDGDEPWLFLPNLRDDVLRSIHSLPQRERIWRRVRAVVEQNSNVRTGQREGRSGEVGRAWEWIGPTSGDGSLRRPRQSGRVSFGPGVKAENSNSPEEDKSYLHQKWEEKRPIY
ncbi:Man1-Src1p-C-terminal domain-containing protein [Whalleya microplaca]|nr:Man1-Src1p-C-terminal domain-containing protein [Whalleya microplaca]